MSRYIFSLPKMLSLTAIYNDSGMLPSIGQISVAKGQTFVRGPSAGFNPLGKPGQQLVRTIEKDEDGNPVVTNVTIGPVTQAYNPITGETVPYDDNSADLFPDNSDPAPLGAWAHPRDRQRGLFFKEWDNWDQVLLRNSNSRIKRLFKNYYNSRYFESGELFGDENSPGVVFFERLREQLRPAPGRGLLPWYLLSALRTNPFNANGEICEDDD